MYIFTYHCDTCHLTASACSGRPGYYVFGDGTRLPARTFLAWCHSCSTFVPAEALPAIDHLDDEISRLRSGALTDADIEHSQMTNSDLASHVAARLATLTQVQDRFRDRMSANRCLECGSTDFEYLEDVDTPVPEHWPHETCGGTWRLISSEHATPATYFLLDKEGNRVAVGNIIEM